LFRFTGREGDIPNVRLSADVENIDDVLVIHGLIASDDDRLIRVELGKPLELIQEFLRIFLLPIHDNCTVGCDIDYHLTDVGLGFVSLCGRWDPDIQLVLGQRKVPGDDKKHQNDQKDVDHWRNHEPEYPGLWLFAKIH
jgi:hypothetical protein